MLAQWVLTEDQFVQLNDNVDADSCALVLGQQVSSHRSQRRDELNGGHSIA